MCHETTYTHSCTHKIKTPRLLCSLASLPSILHSIQKAKVPLLFPCPTCSARLGQPITYPYQPSVPPPAPAAAAQFIYQVPGAVVVPAQVRQIPGPGSWGTPLPIPSGSTTETRLEFRQGAWRPVVHYRFPASSALPPPTTVPPPVTVPVPPPAPAPAVVSRPANLEPNRGWSSVHGVDLGPGPPGPQPSGNGGNFSVVDGNFGWGPLPVVQVHAQPASAQPSSSSASRPAPQVPQQPQTATSNSTSAPPPQSQSQPQSQPPPAQAPQSGPPPNILAAAAIQAPLPPQTHIPHPQAQPTQITQAQPSSSSTPISNLAQQAHNPPEQPPEAQQTPNEAARNARAESLLGMNSSLLARLTAANTDANAHGGGGDGNANGGRPASA